MSSLFVLIVICKNDLSASYFTYKDAYWTVLYEKPYSRMLCYLAGVVTGCAYFSFKHERNLGLGEIDNEDEDPAANLIGQERETNKLHALFLKIQKSSWAALLAIGGGMTVSQLLVFLWARINSSPKDVHLGLSLFFLMVSRPVFCCTTALALMPFILRAPILAFFSNFLCHNFWFMFARLSYGAYLSSQVFMMFRVFNSERGIWACEIDAFLYYLAYLSLAFLFSFVVTLLVEMPVVNTFKVFILD